eukprot:808517_1
MPSCSTTFRIGTFGMEGMISTRIDPSVAAKPNIKHGMMCVDSIVILCAACECCKKKKVKRSHDDGSNQSEAVNQVMRSQSSDGDPENNEPHETNDNHGSSQDYWSSKVHHKACYGLLILQPDHHQPNTASLRLQTTQGITMSSYLERYEIKQRQKVESQ